jgi:hypothetical protein
MVMLFSLKNILLVMKDQGPIKRFVRNFFVTRNAWGLFHINSHVSTTSNKEKVKYNRKMTAEKAAISMQKKQVTTILITNACFATDIIYVETKSNNRKNSLHFNPNRYSMKM